MTASLCPKAPSYLGAGKGKTILTYCVLGKNNLFASAGDGIISGKQGFSGFSIRLADEAAQPDAFFWLGHPWGMKQAMPPSAAPANSLSGRSFLPAR